MVILLALQILASHVSRADESFPTAAAPLFLVLDNFHRQANELVGLPCVREEGYDALVTLADRVATLQTKAAKETDSFLFEMQKSDPLVGDSCGGSFGSLVVSIDGKRSRTQTSQDVWSELGKQLDQTTEALLPMKTIRFAATEEAGGGGGPICVRKAKQLRSAMIAGATWMTTQFKAVNSSLEATGEQFAIYREQNAKLAAGCGQTVAPDPYPAQTAHAHSNPSLLVAGKSKNLASDVTGIKEEGTLTQAQAPAPPRITDKEVSALRTAMRADDAAADASADEALTGFSAEDKLRADAKHGLEGAVAESTDTHTTGAFQSLRELLHEEPRDAGRRTRDTFTAEQRAPSSVPPGADHKGGEGAAIDLFKRVHACYERNESP